MPRHPAPHAPEGEPFLEAPKPSKTQMKKVSHDLQSLGEDLLELPKAKLAKLPMPERLLDALNELRRIKNFEGRRRQLQFVGKLMRDVDPEPLREAVAEQRLPSARQVLAMHEAEAWRDRLIDQDTALTEWLDAHPADDVQALRTMVRNARKEAQQAAAAQANDGAVERKGRHYRDLFQHVKAALAATQARPSEDDEEGDDDDDA